MNGQAPDPSAIYIGIAAIVTASTGLVGALTALIRVLRNAPRRPPPPPDPDPDEGTNS